MCPLREKVLLTLRKMQNGGEINQPAKLLIVAVKVVGWHLNQALINSRRIVCED